MRTAAGLCAPTTCATIFPKDSNDVTSSMRTLTIRIQISYVNLLFVVLVSVHRAFNSTDQNGSQQPHIDAPNLRIFSVIHRRFHFRCDIFQVDAVTNIAIALENDTLAASVCVCVWHVTKDETCFRLSTYSDLRILNSNGYVDFCVWSWHAGSQPASHMKYGRRRTYMVRTDNVALALIMNVLQIIDLHVFNLEAAVRAYTSSYRPSTNCVRMCVLLNAKAMNERCYMNQWFGDEPNIQANLRDVRPLTCVYLVIVIN